MGALALRLRDRRCWAHFLAETTALARGALWRLTPYYVYGIFCHMSAALVFYEKRMIAGGAIIEMTIWRVPVSVPPTTHRLKYSLFYGFAGRRVVAFDNERGKGDHMHVDEEERPYVFTTVEQLISDFLAEVRKAGGEP